MIIKDISIQNFGKFNNQQITFQKGLNVIYGENESGKSTLHTFIQGIFFGIRKMRGRASKNDTYSRLEPWENSGYYEGKIRFLCGNKCFRLERSFHKERPRAELVCETDGERLSIEDGDLSVLLGNISESIYDNTVSVGQLRCRTNEDLVTELRNYMSNYQGSLDGQLDIKKALASLREKRRSYEQQLQEKQSQKDGQAETIYAKLTYLEEEIKNFIEEIAACEKHITILKHEIQDAQNYNESQNIRNLPDTQKSKVLNRTYGRTPKKAADLWTWPVLLVMAGLMVISLIFLPGVAGKLAGIGGLLLFIILRILIGIHGRENLNSGENQDQKTTHYQEKAQHQLEEKKELLKKRQWEWENLSETKKEKAAVLGNLKEAYQELQTDRSGLLGIEEEIESITLAIETIQSLSQNMQNGISRQLKSMTARVLSDLTDEKYTQVSINPEFKMGISTLKRYIPLEQLSRGTVEQVYFSLRMAVGELLCREEPLPVLLDDVFAMYDEKRLAQTLKWLLEHKEQALIFTCHKREIELLNEMGAAYHLINL